MTTPIEHQKHAHLLPYQGVTGAAPTLTHTDGAASTKSPSAANAEWRAFLGKMIDGRSA